MRAARRPRFDAGRLGHAAGPPARALDRPRDDVLDPAEDGAAPAGRLVGAKAVVRVDVVPAPAARLAVQQIDAEKVVQSRRASGDCRDSQATTGRRLPRGHSARAGSLSLKPRKRRTTGMKKGMEESYVEDLANRDGPAHALVSREGAAKRWCRGARRPVMQPRNRQYRGADVLWFSGRQHRWRRFREPSADLAGSKNPCMRAISSC